MSDACIVFTVQRPEMQYIGWPEHAFSTKVQKTVIHHQTSSKRVCGWRWTYGPLWLVISFIITIFLEHFVHFHRSFGRPPKILDLLSLTEIDIYSHCLSTRGVSHWWCQHRASSLAPDSHGHCSHSAGLNPTLIFYILVQQSVNRSISKNPRDA